MLSTPLKSKRHVNHFPNDTQLTITHDLNTAQSYCSNRKTHQINIYWFFDWRTGSIAVLYGEFAHIEIWIWMFGRSKFRINSNQWHFSTSIKEKSNQILETESNFNIQENWNVCEAIQKVNSSIRSKHSLDHYPINFINSNWYLWWWTIAFFELCCI